ncbi:MAG: glucose-1-phosphate thymidylyltransferase RfbA [Deltaproteobacteria bacterium]|nr:glucose-1-phosphate thymidylyltransferase RfbA [Deltaproteobacteria bacterium]
MKGIILAGGSGTRLYPVTLAVSKQLLPVYDKPMIYYPLSLLMLAGIREILVITTERDQESYQRLLKDGSQWGVQLQYAVQEKPNGLAEAFIIGEKFIGKDACSLVLGDNILYKDRLQHMLQECAKLKEGAYVFGYHVSDPQRYGVIEFDRDPTMELNDAPIRVLSVEEKPTKPKSNYAAIGIYFYDNQVVEMAKRVTPSKRGELEITSINNMYLEKKQLKAMVLGRGAAWLDMGTHESFLEAGQFVHTIEKRQGFKIADLDEIAQHMGYV